MLSTLLFLLKDLCTISQLFISFLRNLTKPFLNFQSSSLAIADNLTLLHDLCFSIPSKILFQGSEEDSTAQCVLFGMGNVLTIGGGFHLLIIAMDRFLFINFPFRYSDVLQKANYPSLFVCWVPGNLIGLAIEWRACHERAFVDNTQNIIISEKFSTTILTALYIFLLLSP